MKRKPLMHFKLKHQIFGGTTDNVFRPNNNALTDLPINNAFEFTDLGTINSSINTYTIGIKTK